MPDGGRGMPQPRGGGEEKAGTEVETSQDFALLGRPKSCCDPENPTKREVSHPQMPERHHLKSSEAKNKKKGGRGSPRSGTEFSWCLRVRTVQGDAVPLERDRVWKR